MNNKVDTKQIMTTSQNNIAVNNNTVKEYINYSKKILDQFKKMQEVIQSTQGPEISILIKVAQKNLTTTAIKQCDEMIKEFQLKFNEKSTEILIEQSITLITSIETANYIYGSIIDVDDIRKYISSKITKTSTIISEKLLKELSATKYDDTKKMSFIIDNLNLCIRIFEFAWDICTENIKALNQNNEIINTMITNRIKLGLDNYNIELLRGVIERNSLKINNVKSAGLKTQKDVSNNEINNKKFDNIVTSNESFFSDIDFKVDSTDLTIVKNKRTITDKFIDMTNNVIDEVTESSSNDFLNIALQKFYSIIGSIETINYLKGDVVNKGAVSNNISHLLADVIYTNYTALNKSWSEITDKSVEDKNAYSKEIRKYCEILIESYNMCNNIDALKKCVIIENNIYNLKEDFKLTKSEIQNLRKTIDKQLSVINKVDPKFTVQNKTQTKEQPKKKGFWAKIFK